MGRELINWSKDTHILFSMTLSGGDVTWWEAEGFGEGVARGTDVLANQGLAPIRLGLQIASILVIDYSDPIFQRF